jgi:hypothetical protein
MIPAEVRLAVVLTSTMARQAIGVFADRAW